MTLVGWIRSRGLSICLLQSSRSGYRLAVDNTAINSSVGTPTSDFDAQQFSPGTADGVDL